MDEISVVSLFHKCSSGITFSDVHLQRNYKVFLTEIMQDEVSYRRALISRTDSESAANENGKSNCP